MMTYHEFRVNTLKANKKKGRFKIHDSYSTKDLYRKVCVSLWYRKPKPISEKQFRIIIGTINSYLQNRLIHGFDIHLPSNMGNIELAKFMPKLEFKDGKLKTNLPVNWNETLRLWHSDKSAYEAKTIVRSEVKELFKIRYNKTRAKYKNKIFIKFDPARSLRISLKDAINNNETDAHLLKKRYEFYKY